MSSCPPHAGGQPRPYVFETANSVSVPPMTEATLLVPQAENYYSLV